NGTTYFNFLGRWTVIVRMLSGKHKVVLNRTQLAMLIQENADTATPRLGAMFEGTTKLYLGYVEAADPDEIDVVLVCPEKHRNAWFMPIEPPAGAEVVPLPTRAPAPDDEQLVKVTEKPKPESGEP